VVVAFSVATARTPVPPQRAQTTLIVDVVNPLLVFVDGPGKTVATNSAGQAEESYYVRVERGWKASFVMTVQNQGLEPINYTVVTEPPTGSRIALALDDGIYARSLAPGGFDLLHFTVFAEPDLFNGPRPVVIKLQ